MAGEPSHAQLDFRDADVIDSHCHPFRLDELVEVDPDDWEARCTLLGMCYVSSDRIHPGLWPDVKGLNDSTVFALALRRWLAEYLGCEPTRDEVALARAKAFRSDPGGYTKRLLADQRLVGVLADEGYPKPPVPRQEFEAALGVPVSRVARLEPWIEAHRDGSDGFDGLLAGVQSELEAALADSRCVAVKSIVAYRTGLDIGSVEEKDARDGYARWRADGWRESRDHSKLVRDFLLERVLETLMDHDRAFHIHSGGGDPDIQLSHAHPQDLLPFLLRHSAQPIVLIHTGYPWVSEAGYVASILPNVYLELSVLIPWGWSAIPAAIETLVGTVPTAKLLYGSDEASEPEILWIAARIAKAALARSLGGLVDRDQLTVEEADRIGRGILAENTRRLHGLGDG